ncbi:heterogeneous nuclear ribonucleoprotein 27C-like isoform X2 [Planococcus citri]|uniref:heterogeneous nuclear ribonucleoprotein 27C-like isoform X2 n=1 Tax=Planococcus citri TaxID=170843 RepID=UPI0031F84B9A
MINRVKPDVEDDERGKLFIGGLSWETTQEDLQRYFGRFGEVIDCVVMKNSESGRSRGFGFVTFADPANVDVVLRSGPHVLDSRTIDPKPCNPRSLQRKKNNVNYPKVFLGGLPTTCTETDLRNVFSRFGNVMEVVIMYDQEKKKSRGFGFLSFETEDAVDRCVMEHFVSVNGKQVEIKRVEMRDKSASNGQWGQNIMSIGTGNGPIGSIDPNSMSQGYLGWGSAGYGYGNPSASAGYQNWGAPATPQVPTHWSSTYGTPNQTTAYGSYAPPPQAGYGGSWNWGIQQNGSAPPPTAAAAGYASQGAPHPGAHQGDMYTRAGAIEPSSAASNPQKTDYAGYGGYGAYQQDSANYGAPRSYTAPDGLAPPGMNSSAGATGAGSYGKAYDYKEWPAS